MVLPLNKCGEEFNFLEKNSDNYKFIRVFDLFPGFVAAMARVNPDGDLVGNMIVAPMFFCRSVFSVHCLRHLC